MRCRDCVVGLFDVCHGEYCAAERAGLIEQAQAAAAGRGHTLGEFVQVKRRPAWEAHCGRCGKVAGIRLDPQPGEQDVYGEAVTAVCPTVLP